MKIIHGLKSYIEPFIKLLKFKNDNLYGCEISRKLFLNTESLQRDIITAVTVLTNKQY